MNPAYKVLYDHVMNEIHDNEQARKIVDFALLEGMTVGVETKDPEAGTRRMMEEIDRLVEIHKHQQRK
ncbi:hypothetical protein [Paraflavitalea speifideaquila]|uniref:hypothetical protein n=1 Tax=Paraflavitalea speifideaquila TaxID=3076558 RepID=UPI0028F10352|nr:hypothetical protein [Paraflavitalea speifideiaquila]